MRKSRVLNIIVSFVLLLFFETACKMQTNSVDKNWPAKQNANVSIPSGNSPSENKSDGNAQQPALITRVIKTGGKPPLRFYRFDIEFQSRREEFVWLLTRYYGDKPLPASGSFSTDGTTETPLSADERRANGSAEGRAIVVRFLGADSFRAIRVPIRGTLKFSPFIVNSWSDFSELELWEVETLLVNGKTPLDEWLPYDTQSESSSRVFSEASFDVLNLNLDKDSKAIRSDYRKEEVKFVLAKNVRKWQIPFRTTSEKP